MAAIQRMRARQILREAEGYLELKMAQQALGVLERLDAASASHSQALYLRGEALRLLGRDREAIDCLEQASDLAPSNVAAWVALADVQKRAGRLDQAIEALEHARQLEPRAAEIQYQLACYHSLAGRKNRAIECLTRALAIDAGMRKRVHAEPDFDSIRDDPDFQALAGIIV